MAVRKISIDKEKCDGCGLCVTACHEGAIELVDGKAELAAKIRKYATMYGRFWAPPDPEEKAEKTEK